MGLIPLYTGKTFGHKEWLIHFTASWSVKWTGSAGSQARIGRIAVIRMFAVPNGLGKSTFKSTIHPELLKMFINADAVEKDMQQYSATIRVAG